MSRSDPKQGIEKVANRLIREANKFSPLLSILKQVRENPGPPTIAPLEESAGALSCGNCTFFSAPQDSMLLLFKGVDIIGWCQEWDEPTMANKYCQSHNEGSPQIM